MKILVVCQRGNVRSVTVATLLKDYAGLNDVIAIGAQTSSLETLLYMTKWADLIINAGQEDLRDYFQFPILTRDDIHRDDIEDKWVYLGIEVDRWQKSMHPELMRIVLDALHQKTDLLDHVNPPFYSNLETYLAANEAAYNRK